MGAKGVWPEAALAYRRWEDRNRDVIRECDRIRKEGGDHGQAFAADLTGISHRLYASAFD